MRECAANASRTGANSAGNFRESVANPREPVANLRELARTCANLPKSVSVTDRELVRECVKNFRESVDFRRESANRHVHQSGTPTDCSFQTEWQR